MVAAIGIDRDLEIDDDDKKILSLMQKDINITQSEIATKINKIQPAVGARILKLERKHLLTTKYGINLSKVKLPMAIVRLYAKNSKEVFESINSCPYVLNAFTTLGRTNITAMMVGPSIEKLEEIVENHFRSNPDIKHVELSVVMEPVNQMILPVDFNIEAHDNMKCNEECHSSAASHVHDDEKYSPVAKGKLGSLLKIDDDDKRIIMQLQADPDTTQEELGELIGKSQPAVGARITKLLKNNVLAIRKGVDFKEAKGMQVVQVSIATSDAGYMIKKLGSCDSFNLGFRVVNENSIIVFIAGSSLDEIEVVIDTCIRSDERVKSVETLPVIKFLRSIVLSFNFECDFVEGIGCSGCAYCGQKLNKELANAILRGKSITG